jgi:hypothetical protein
MRHDKESLPARQAPRVSGRLNLSHSAGGRAVFASPLVGGMGAPAMIGGAPGGHPPGGENCSVSAITPKAWA